MEDIIKKTGETYSKHIEELQEEIAAIEEVFVDWDSCRFHPSYIPSDEYLNGVYIIWDSRMGVIKIGKGNIPKNLNKDFKDEKIEFYASQEVARVKYGHVSEEKQAGLERYLIETYKPLLAKSLDLTVERIKPETMPFKDHP